MPVATWRKACRDRYPKPTVWGLWILTEIAIAATDLAEVIGTIIGLKLLFGVDYLWGLAIAGCDTLILLSLQRRGIRLLELMTLFLVAIIAGSFFVEIVMARPDWGGVLRGFVPGLDPEATRDSLYVAIGMLGATVMPHNLYLHSALVQTRAFSADEAGKRMACKYNFFDSLLALNFAFFINAAILVLAATLFTHKVEALPEAHTLLHLWGAGTASVLFAVALLASGQSSTLTGTIAGQVVMEGFVQLRIRPWLRRLVTRAAAILPALLLLSLAGNHTGEDRQEVASAIVASVGNGDPLAAATLTAAGQQTWKVEPVDKRLLSLLVLSQVALSFQLPFAIVPLVQLTSDRRWMGTFANGRVVATLAWLCAVVVVSLNVALVAMQMQEWGNELGQSGHSPWWIYGTIGPLAVGVLCFLAWVTTYPYLRHGLTVEAKETVSLPAIDTVRYRRVGVAVEFVPADAAVFAHAADLAAPARGAAVIAARRRGARCRSLWAGDGRSRERTGSSRPDATRRSFTRQRIGSIRCAWLRSPGRRVDAAIGGKRAGPAGDGYSRTSLPGRFGPGSDDRANAAPGDGAGVGGALRHQPFAVSRSSAQQPLTCPPTRRRCRRSASSVEPASVRASAR